MSINEQGAERRLTIVQEILGNFGLKAKATTPLAFDLKYAYPFNNFIFKVDLETPAMPESFPGSQPGTVAAPASGLGTVVVRMSNLRADDLNHTNRVQNDVACSHLARQSIASAGLPPIVPEVYAWTEAKSLDLENLDDANFGWTITEYKSGADLNGQFPALSAEDKENVLGQMASILAAVQKAAVPHDARQFGGLAFDKQGNIIAAQTSLLHAGPFKSYADVWTYKLQAQLRDSGKSPVLSGWKEGGLDKRVQGFLDSGGVGKVLEAADPSKCSLVHGDLTMNNMLYDSTSKQITALLDFDFSAVTHPAEEFTMSLHDVGGGMTDDPAGILPCVLSNDFSSLPESLSEEGTKKWELAKLWNTIAIEKGVTVLSAIPGIRDIMTLQKLYGTLCPFHLSHKTALKYSSDESKEKKMKEAREVLVRFLEETGY